MTTIKRATVDDLTYLQKVCIETYTANFANHWEEDGLQLYLDACFGTAQLKTELATPTIHYYLAVTSNGAAGFMKFIENSLLPEMPVPHAIELEKIYIHPASKGAGIGQRLLDRLFEHATESNSGLIWLKVIETNVAAQQFYTRNGFEFYKKTRLDAPKFKEELRGMWIMIKKQ